MTAEHRDNLTRELRTLENDIGAACCDLSNAGIGVLAETLPLLRRKMSAASDKIAEAAEAARDIARRTVTDR